MGARAEQAREAAIFEMNIAILRTQGEMAAHLPRVSRRGTAWGLRLSILRDRLLVAYEVLRGHHDCWYYD